MNPAFAILILIFCCVLWVVLRRAYRKVGREVSRIGTEMNEVLNEQELDAKVEMKEEQ